MADIALRSRPKLLTYQVGLLLVLLAGACWSTMGLGIRLMEEATVWQILFYRSMALAPFLFIVMMLKTRGRPFAAIRSAGMSAVSGGLALVGAFSGGIFAIQQTTVANAMFLFAAAPFFAAVLGRVLLGETVRLATWIAMAVGAVGIAIMVQEGISLGNWLGDAMATLSGFGFAVFTLALRDNKAQDMLPAVFLSGIFAMAIAGGMCWGLGLGIRLPVNDIMLAFALGVFQVGTGLTIYTIGSRVVPAAELALLSMTEVVLGPFWVWLFLNETASLQTLVGGAILLAAIAGNALSGLRRRPAPVGLR